MSDSKSKSIASAVKPDVTFDVAATYTPGQLADMLNVGPKSFRAWLRNETSRKVGQGNRWILSGDVARDLYDAFASRSRTVTDVTLRSKVVADDDVTTKVTRKADVTTSADGTVSVPKSTTKNTRKIDNKA